jgi:enoyl-[acyl-carrier protein] reductase I
MCYIHTERNHPTCEEQSIMGLLDGKTALIFGVADKHSIAWGITQALKREGATIALSYAAEILKKRVMPLAQEIGVDFVEQCDVTKDEDLDAVFAKAKARYGKIDVLVHAVAFANKDELRGQYAATSRAGFHVAMDISVYSLVAMAQRAKDIMPDGGSILTLTYYGSEKVIPNYNVMGVAKAALEASVRYLAADLGPQNIRVNAISAGAIKTLAMAGIAGSRDMLRFGEMAAPLKRRVTIEDVGNSALWLCSNLGGAVTGEVIYVDAGIHIMGLSLELLGERQPSSEEASQ